MSHDDARAWLEDAFFRPGVLALALEPPDTAGEQADPVLAAVREHLAACADCDSYLASLREAALALDVTLGPSPQVRARLLETVRALGRQRGSVARPQPVVPRAVTTVERPEQEAPIGARRWSGLSGLSAAAVLVFVALGAAVLGGVLAIISQQPASDGRLARAVGVMADMAAEPETRRLVLRDASGANAGLAFVSGSRAQLAVLTTALDAVEDGYSCYLDRGGERTEIGPMHYSGGISFWAGPLEADAMGREGDRFVVARDGAPTAPAVLVGQFTDD